MRPQSARPPSTAVPPGGGGGAHAASGRRFPFRQISSAGANGSGGGGGGGGGGGVGIGGGGGGGGGGKAAEPVDPVPDYSLLGDVELGWARSTAIPRKSAADIAREKATPRVMYSANPIYRSKGLDGKFITGFNSLAVSQPQPARHAKRWGCAGCQLG